MIEKILKNILISFLSVKLKFQAPSRFNKRILKEMNNNYDYN